MKRPHFPKQIVLPFGFVVPVVYYHRRAVNGMRLGKLAPGRERLGYWDGSRIVINKDAPLWEQAAVIAHELVHVADDYQLYVKDQIVEPMLVEVGATILEEDDYK